MDPPTPSTVKDVASNQASTLRQDEDIAKEESMLIGDTAFQLVPPRMPVGRDSDYSVLPRGMRLDSQGTQYDVTSFIGGE